MSKFIENLGFMVYDKRLQVLRPANYIYFNKKNDKGEVGFDLTDEACSDMVRNFNEVELLPCTGHKDIKGKPLYVGAIIKFNDELYEVCYNDNQGFCIANTVTWQSAVFADKCSEIVGNIFENEDLKKEVRGE